MAGLSYGSYGIPFPFYIGRYIRDLVAEARIEAEADVLVKPQDTGIQAVMHEASRDADLVFLGLKVPEPGEEADYAKRLNELASGFSTAVFVRNGEPFAGEMLGEKEALSKE